MRRVVYKVELNLRGRQEILRMMKWLSTLRPLKMIRAWQQTDGDGLTNVSALSRLTASPSPPACRKRRSAS
jgi:hypothetical protein